MMTKIKNFTETNFEFEEIARLYNLVSHDDKDHPDDIKDAWEIRDKSIIRDRLMLYIQEKAIGYLGYLQGRAENNQNCYFNIFLDPDYNGHGYRTLLYEEMLKEVQAFNCKHLYMSVYEHENYNESKKLLVKNGFKNDFKVRESSLDLSKLDLGQYASLIKKLNQKGIKFYDAKNEMKDFPDHYKKLEELIWKYFQDMPMPKGISHTRMPFNQFIKYQNRFEEKLYGTQIIAVLGKEYIGATDIYVKSKSDPNKAWTGSLGVLHKYRRQGIATALKVKAFEALRKKGVKTVRTDNEENNPMYLINVALGFTPEPYCLEYQKDI